MTEMTEKTHRASSFEVRFFAGFDVRVGDRPLPALRSRREQWLLALLVLRQDRDTSRDWLAASLDASHAEPQDRFRLLAGRPRGAATDQGPIVCACFEVGMNEIAECVRGGCRSVAEVGQASKAGTNCGSCRAEIGRLIDAARIPQAV